MSSNDDALNAPGKSSSVPPAYEKTEEEEERVELISKARSFLLSPAIQHEDSAAKRRFLQEKGLTDEEIDGLMTEISRQPPPVPPRTYPSPPPSNLPFLIASLFRIFTWAAGISGVLLLGYHRLLLPRIMQSLGARHKLGKHQSELMKRLTARIEEVKTAQEEVYDSLPPPQVEQLPANVTSMEDLPMGVDGNPAHSLLVVLRCAFLGQPDQKYTLEQIYDRLLKKFYGLTTSDQHQLKRAILRELSRSGLFNKILEEDSVYWTPRPTADADISQTLTTTRTLESLRSAISRGCREGNMYQHTFKSLTDFTGFLSRETFAVYGSGSGFRHVLGVGTTLGPAEEEMKREIRALKGLVLNRRSFAPIPYRPPATPASSTTTAS